ncbi:MAG: MmgE/PrpD family protein [Victivallaceae bacterium]|nr:MmgE/PrpD family protein [Victivallaceae bacterium]MDD4180677.1 MmgE/PrpD family protein [Victivallaceae bacterium]
MSISQILSELTLNTLNDDIPESSYAATVRMVLDTIACAYAGKHAPGIDDLIELENEISTNGDGTVFFNSSKLALPSAAFCNSAMVHAMDFDNNYPQADIHILSIVVPVAVACAESSRCSGRDFLSAIILGVEVAARISKPYIAAKRRHSYFLTTSLTGGWGGVATAARIFGLSVSQMINAMGIYYAHTCGNRQALLEKSLTKRIQPAIATKAALYSVMLASKGFTGPEHSFEGIGGLYNCYTLDPPPKLTSFLAPPNPFGIEELVIKKIPTCGIHHACIMSALYLKGEYNLKYSEINRVEFFLSEGGGTLVSMPFCENTIPQVAAQFCAPYAIALALTRGDVNVCRFTNEAVIKDRKTAELAKRTTEINVFSELELKNYPEYENGHEYLKVYLHDNKVLEHKYCRTDLCETLTGDIPFIKNKLFQCLAVYGSADSQKVDRLIAVTELLYKAENITELIAELQSEL